LRTLVFSEKADLLNGLLGLALQLAGSPDSVSVVAHRGVLDDAVGRAKRVYLVDAWELTDEAAASAILRACGEFKPDLVLTLSTYFGRSVCSYVAAKLDAEPMTEVIEVTASEGVMRAVRLAYGGHTQGVYAIRRYPAVLSIHPSALRPSELPRVESELVTVAPEEGVVKRVEVRRVETAGRRLAEADVIVALGRGIGKREGIALVEELASLLDAEVGCSRPIAVDLRWMPDWVGISGVQVKPSLYVALGISGQIQHVAGVRGAKRIVVVNKSREVPFFEEADYFIESDLYAFLPHLIEELRKLRK